jgi:ssDNA-binding Zn-finger/Zn-ribbon topoisomerase 1
MQLMLICQLSCMTTCSHLSAPGRPGHKPPEYIPITPESCPQCGQTHHINRLVFNRAFIGINTLTISSKPACALALNGALIPRNIAVDAQLA